MICDPYYLFLDWSHMSGGPVPQQAWTGQSADCINVVANFENCYEVASRQSHLMACGTLIAQCQGLRVIPVTHVVPIEVEFR
jgi:hypothetical protein